MTGLNVNSTSHSVRVTSTTQHIYVDPSTSEVSIELGGPVGPPGVAPTVAFDDLTDVNPTGKTQGSVPKWDEGTDKWVMDEDNSAVDSVDGRTGNVTLDDKYLSLDGGTVDSGSGEVLTIQDDQFELIRTTGDSVTDITLTIGGVAMSAAYGSDRRVQMELSQTYVNFSATDNAEGEFTFFEVGSNYIQFYTSNGAKPTINGSNIATEDETIALIMALG